MLIVLFSVGVKSATPTLFYKPGGTTAKSSPDPHALCPLTLVRQREGLLVAANGRRCPFRNTRRPMFEERERRRQLVA